MWQRKGFGENVSSASQEESSPGTLNQNLDLETSQLPNRYKK